MIKIYLVGISCVGKSTIGKALAQYLNFNFYDFDHEVENYYAKPIEYIKKDFITMHSYRGETAIVLKNIFKKNENMVIASCPSGLRDNYLTVYKKNKMIDKIISIYIIDSPENILKRLTFYDKQSRQLNKILTDYEKKYYLKEIKKDTTYFKKFYNRADYQFNIDGIDLTEIPFKLTEFIKSYDIEFKEYTETKDTNNKPSSL